MNFNNFVGLASASQVDGDDARAAELFKRALQERPNADWIHRNLAPALLASGNEAEARDSCRRLLAAYPNFTIAQFRSAMVFSPEFLERDRNQLRALGGPGEVRRRPSPARPRRRQGVVGHHPACSAASSVPVPIASRISAISRVMVKTLCSASSIRPSSSSALTRWER